MCAVESSNPTYGLADTIQRLEALIGQEHISEHYVRFRIDLLKAQWGVRDALAGASPTFHAVAETPRRPEGEDRQVREPVLEADGVALDRGLLESLLTALVEAVAKRGSGSADASRLAAAAAKEPELLEELARKAAFGPDQAYLESLAQRLEVSVDGLLFFGRALAAPFVAEAARRVKEHAGSARDAVGVSGHCTVCGSPPAMARLRQDDGGRTLYCSLCGESWPFRRLECPYCGNSDHESLGFLRIAEMEPRWIEICDKCKRYLKTVDERRLPEGEKIIPLVEETATLHLDLLAEREGYLRSLPYAAAR